MLFKLNFLVSNTDSENEDEDSDNQSNSSEYVSFDELSDDNISGNTIQNLS